MARKKNSIFVKLTSFKFDAPHEFSFMTYWSFGMLGLTMVLSFIGVIQSVVYDAYQPILTVDSMFIMSISAVLHVVVEYNDVYANSYLFLTSFVFMVLNFVWMISSLTNMGSGGALNSGDRTFHALYNGAIQYNEEYVRLCYVNPYDNTFYIIRFVFMSILVGMEAIFFPRFTYLFQYSFRERIRIHDIEKMFRSLPIDEFAVKSGLSVLLILHASIILFMVYANFPPLYVFVDSPNSILTSAFVFLIVTNVMATKNDVYRIAIIALLCFGSVLSSMNSYNEEIYAGISWMNETGLYYDMKTQVRVGGFCIYEGDGNEKSIIKFALLQERYHILNVLYCLTSPGLIPYIIFKKSMLP